MTRQMKGDVNTHKLQMFSFTWEAQARIHWNVEDPVTNWNLKIGHETKSLGDIYEQPKRNNLQAPQKDVSGTKSQPTVS